MKMFASLMIVALVGVGSAPLALAQGKGGQGSNTAVNVDAPLCEQVPDTNTPIICSCPGDANGSVWGSGPYTSDSSICTAARHAGVVGAAGGALQLVRRPGQASYAGSERNGVSTSSWGSYGESFDVLALGAVVVSGDPDCGVLPAGTDRQTCGCRADITGSVWGSGPYTADSNICSAARHAGLVGADGGSVTVLRIVGLPAYSGSEANGETTGGWGSYEESIVFDRN